MKGETKHQRKISFREKFRGDEIKKKTLKKSEIFSKDEILFNISFEVFEDDKKNYICFKY